MIDTGLKNKAVLLTGGNNPYGIGAASAKALAAQGAKVFIQYLRMPPPDAGVLPTDPNTPGEAFYYAQRAKPPDEVVDAIRRLGGQIDASEADLADPTAIPHLFDRAGASFGPVDVLVNNAGGNEPDTFIPQSALVPESRAAGGRVLTTITAETYERNFGINSRAVALMMVEYARRHIERGAQWGRIINVSTNGASGFRTSVSYGAGKHAMESYSRAAASELGKYGITVNVVSLGSVQTGWIVAELEANAVRGIPLGRIGKPEEVADVIVFFASEQARWVTGQLLYVDGGAVMPL